MTITYFPFVSIKYFPIVSITFLHLFTPWGNLLSGRLPERQTVRRRQHDFYFPCPYFLMFQPLAAVEKGFSKYQKKSNLHTYFSHSHTSIHLRLLLWKVAKKVQRLYFFSCPGSSIPDLGQSLTEWLTHCHFRILTQRVTFETWDPLDIWSEW